MRAVILALAMVALICSPEGSMAGPSDSASATATVTLTIEQFGVATDMKVTPRTLNPGEAPPPDDDPNGVSDLRSMVECRIKVPVCLQGQGLAVMGDGLYVNGVHLQAVVVPPGSPPEYPLETKTITVRFVRYQVIQALGEPWGQRVMMFEGIITGGHLLVASDTVYLQPK